MKCSVYIAASLDGFIARANGAIDWLEVVNRDGEDYGFKTFFDSVDVMVMGRKTYETALSFDQWHYAGKRVVVLTHQALEARHGETFYAGDLKALVERLAAEGARHVYVDGGAVIAQFLAAKLVDHVTVSIIPVLLGEGIPLTPKIGSDVALNLIDHEAFESGLVQLHYAVRTNRS